MKFRVSIQVNNQLVEKTTQNTVNGIDQCEANIKFEDVSEKVEQCLPLSNAYVALLDPFPPQTPNAYLSKEYKIDSITIDDTFVPGTFRTWVFPDDLFAVPQIADVIKHYRYFRSDVQVDFRFTPSAFHQGCGQISFVPLSEDPDPGVTGVNPIYRWSACQPVDVSFASQQSATICLPYLNPAPYIDLVKTAPTIPAGLIGSVVYSQITPYRVISDVGSFQLSVWAKFINPIVAGPIAPTASAKRTRKVPAHQSDQSSSSSIRASPESHNTRRYVDPESLVKTTSDALVSGVSNGPLSPVIKAVGSGMTFAEDVTKAITSFFGLFDKPTSVKSPSPMMPQFGRDFTLTSGLDSSLRIGQHPTSKLATTGVFSMETSHITMAKLAQIPMLHHVDFFNSTRSTFDLKLRPKLTLSSAETNYTRDYFHYVAASHRMWRGSIKYRIKFVCGQFIKARVQISVRFSGAVDTTGQIFTRVIEVNGETETLLSVPFLLNRYWSYYDEADAYEDIPVLQFTLIDSVVGGSTADDPTVDVIIWRAAGEDIQFAGLQRAQYTSPIFSEAPEHQTSLREVFSKPFDSVVCDCKKAMELGYCTDDLSTTVADAMKRYVGHPNVPTEVSFQYDWLDPNNGFAASVALNSVFSEPFWYFKKLFWFWRGDLRFRFISQGDGVDGVMKATLAPLSGSDYNEANGHIYTHSKHNPELQLELPYSSCYPYIPNQGGMSTQINFTQLTDTQSVLGFKVDTSGSTGNYIAASDNYVCGMLAPPPYCDGPAPPASKKTTNVKIPTTTSSASALKRSTKPSGRLELTG